MTEIGLISWWRRTSHPSRGRFSFGVLLQNRPDIPDRSRLKPFLSAYEGWVNTMKPMNNTLYERLREVFGSVRVTNEGMPLTAYPRPDYVHRQGRLALQVHDWGETYHVACPFCTDTRHRLYLSHHWGVRERRTREDCLFLAKCHNETNCLNTRESQKRLHALLFPEGRYADEVDVPTKPVVAPAPAPPRPAALPGGTPLNRLHRDHPARRYLLKRGFDADALARDRGVRYLADCRESRLWMTPRLVIPVYALDPSKDAAGGYAPRLAGWQARVVGAVAPHDCPKYLTAAGMKKSRVLYGLEQAIRRPGPVVLVEGPTDAWRVGPQGLALLGKDVSAEQCRLLTLHLRGRPIVVWLDADVPAQGDTVRRRVLAARAACCDPGPVVAALPPPERKDAGECTAAEAACAIEEALFAR